MRIKDIHKKCTEDDGKEEQFSKEISNVKQIEKKEQEKNFDQYGKAKKAFYTIIGTLTAASTLGQNMDCCQNNDYKSDFQQNKIAEYQIDDLGIGEAIKRRREQNKRMEEDTIGKAMFSKSAGHNLDIKESIEDKKRELENSLDTPEIKPIIKTGELEENITKKEMFSKATGLNLDTKESIEDKKEELENSLDTPEIKPIIKTGGLGKNITEKEMFSKLTGLNLDTKESIEDKKKRRT